MRENRVQNNFSAGEITEEAIERADSQIFARGVSEMKNGVITPLGQVRRRPGFGFQADLTASLGLTADARLETYIFSSAQFYLVVFDVGRVHILSVNGDLIQTLSSAPADQLTAARIWEAHYCYRGDSLIITHEAFWPIEVKRLTASTFSIARFGFYRADTLEAWQSTSADNSYRYAPFYAVYPPRVSPNGGGVMLTLSGATGSVTVTASVDYFSPLHVGAIFGLDGSAAPSPYGYMAIYKEGMVITGYTSPTSVTATILGTSSITDLTQEKMQWAECMWNDYRGYPRTAIFHEQRLFFAGSPGHPNAVWGSASSSFSKNGKGDGAYYDFAWMMDNGSGPIETDPLLLFVVDDQVLDIRRLHSYRNLHIMTSTAEFIVPSSLTDAAITPYNFRARKQTPYGTDDQIAPIIYDDAVLFLQRTRKVLREVVYNDLQKAYGAQSLSNLAPHRLSDPRQVALWKGSVTTPEALLLMVQADGTISVMQGSRGNDTLGWHYWSTPGRFRSIATVYDHVFALVEREVGGVLRMYLERMDEATCLDCMLEFAGSTSDRLSGQARLEGQTASVTTTRTLLKRPTREGEPETEHQAEVHVADGPVLDGALDLPTVVGAGNSGLDPGFLVQLLPPQPLVRNGISVAEPKRLGRLGIGVKDCTSLTVDGQDRGPYKRRHLPDDLTHLYDGNLPAQARGAAKRLVTTISQARPGPLTLLSVARDVVF